MTHQSKMRLALIAMPWPLFNRPSIQLGSLKAYLQCEWLTVQTFHPYLAAAKAIHPEKYLSISRHMWLSEALYAPLAFPEQQHEARKLAKKISPKATIPSSELPDIEKALTDQLVDFIEETDWQAYDLVGFSVCFNQFFSSLAAARLLKEKHPHLPLVFGGSAILEEMESFLRETVNIDYLICGEGEEKLLALCNRLAGHAETGDNNTQLSSLASLPCPDYDDYFSHLKKTFGFFLPTVPVELSRGCWWRKCTFCNLNKQWKGYRVKNVSKVHQEIITLSHRHQILDFAFTDNALPIKESKKLFTKLQKSPYRFFGEIRANQATDFSLYKKGGLSRVQVGIEALSNSLLKKMNKGSTVMENIYAIKMALANGILLEGNLITEFPGSTEEEVQETLDVLDFLSPFPPLDKAGFFLGNGSPVALAPKQYAITSIFPHRFLKKILPPSKQQIPFLVLDYRGDRSYQQRIWRTVNKKIGDWKTLHRGKNVLTNPMLSMRDGGSFLLIRQERPNGQINHHRLQGNSRKIFLALERPLSFSEISDRFPVFKTQVLLHFLNDLTKKRLVYSDQSGYLALAIAEKN